MNNIGAIYLDEILRTERYLKKKKKIEKELLENPDKVIDYYKEYPYFFSILYLRFRKWQSMFLRSNITICEGIYPMSSDEDDEISWVICKYFYNVDIYEDENLDGIYYKEKLNKFIYKISGELDDFYKEDIHIENFLTYEYNTEGDEVALLRIILDADFKQFFLFPIVKGNYDDEMERICKQCLLKLSLSEEV